MDSLLAAGMLQMRDQVPAVYFNVKHKSKPNLNPNHDHNLSLYKNHTPYPNPDPNTNKCYVPTSQCKCTEI